MTKASPTPKESQPEASPKKDVIIRDSTRIPIGKLRELKDNVNYETDAQFNRLVQSIQDDGFNSPIEVCPNADGTYTVISGNHRLKAAKYLDLKELPCVVREDVTSDELRETQAIRRNIIRGQFDPVMFTKVFNRLQGKYSKEVLQEMMGVYDQQLFDKLYKQARAALPPHMKDQLDKSKKNLRSIDDLSNVLNQLFTEYGTTLPHNFMFFNYGGKIHLMVKMNAKLKRIMTKVSRICTHDEGDICEMLCELMKDVDKMYPDEQVDGFSREPDAEPKKTEETSS